MFDEDLLGDIVTVNFLHLKENTNYPRLEEDLVTKPQGLLASLGALAEVNWETRINPTRRTIRILGYNVITPLKGLKANIISNFITIRGTVVRVSSVKPLITKLQFRCISCNRCFLHELFDGKHTTPKRCGNMSCRGKIFQPVFWSPDSTAVDWQRLRIQEKLADDRVDSGRIPRTVDCELLDDLVDSVVPGDVVCVSGIVQATSVEEGSKHAKSNALYSLYIAVNSMVKASAGSSAADDPKEATEGDGAANTFQKDFVQFNRKDLLGIQMIHGHGKQVFRHLVNSLCPTIFGHEIVKAGLLLSLLGGKNRDAMDKHNLSIRSNAHILIVGDPGLGKSQMLAATAKVAPRGVYVCGNTTTTSGLTVTVCKDSDTGDTALEAGALVLGDRGVCCIDEFDKITEYHALLEAMEQQSISVAKAGIVCSLPARATVVAAANPVGGHYNKAKTVSENLKMNSALLSRFDLIFILLDKPNEDMDRFLSKHIVKLHTNKAKSDAEATKKAALEFHGTQFAADLDESLLARLSIRGLESFDPIPHSLLRKYIAYARAYVSPEMSQEAAELLQAFYLNLRKNHRSPDGNPITTRQLESLVRLAEARAKVDLRTVVTKQDAEDVIAIMEHCLWSSFEDELGMMDFQRSQNVHVSANVHFLLTTYALSTEREETLAMLMGRFERPKLDAGAPPPTGEIGVVEGCLFCPRKDKRKDRVEISSEQLSQAISYAEQTQSSVVGWAHSHPHITVFPSAVDLNCQQNQQLLGENFFGLIISCFDEKNLSQRLQLTCFQSTYDETGTLCRLEIPVFVRPSESGLSHNDLLQLLRIPEIFWNEEREMLENALKSIQEQVGMSEAVLMRSYHSGPYIRALVSLIDKLCIPMTTICQERLDRNLMEIQRLKSRPDY
ncbi:DNA replication licensing factor mcm8 [Phlyctochytrium bullatum]|nr:DNA replication licensing factor mcm8 [Phlyctochytrium bullatum]